MAANSSLNLVDLDFENLKTSFKNYLRNQQQFKDYDFDGSNINVLLDLLAYNTYKNAFYQNMVLSEAFLDSAQLTESVMSHAKELNYVPRSHRSAKARVRVNFEVESPDNQPYVIDKGKFFTTLIKNQVYTFSVPETITVSSSNTQFSFETDIYEGTYTQDSYVFDDTLENPKFRLTNKNADLTSLVVVVIEDNEQIGNQYRLSSTLLDLNETSRVFFVQPAEKGYFDIVFGDNIVGKRPKTGSTVILEYRLSSGPPANSARVFSCGFDPTNGQDEFSGLETTTLDISNGGAFAEDIESVRYYAPRHFQVQERTVTPLDYEITLKTQFPEINAVSVYGGETLNPPQFGKVFVSVDIDEVDGLPDSKKTEYYNFLKRRAPLSIDPVFIEPDFLYLYVNSLIKYDVNLTKLTPERIKTLVTETINLYNQQNLDDFNSTLRYSQLISDIDNSEQSIISNITDVSIYKKLNPRLGTPQNIDVNFYIPLRNDIPNQTDIHPLNDLHAIQSTPFTFAGVKCVIEDDANGILRVMRFEQDRMIKIQNIGTVNYDTGFVQLIGFNISSYEGDAIKIFALPRDRDVSTSKNVILTIEPAGIQLKIQTQ